MHSPGNCELTTPGPAPLSAGLFLYAIGNTATDPQVLRTELATLPHRIGQLRGREVRGLLARSLSMRLAHPLPLIQQTSGVNVTASLGGG